LDSPIGPAFERSMMKQLTLTPTQRKIVTDLVEAQRSAQCIVLRGNLILDCAKCGKMCQVASKHEVGRDTVRRWYQRWQSRQAELDRLETEHQTGTLSQTKYRREIETLLSDAKRPGAPATFTEAEKQQIIAMATRQPEDEGVPVPHWSHEMLAQTVKERGIVKTISAAQIGRFLKGGHLATPSQSVLGTSQHRRLG
jgi:putative transposase